MIFVHFGDARRHIKLCSGIEHRHEAAHHQVINLELGLGEPRFHRLQRRNNGKVVADFGIVKNAAIGLDPVLLQNLFRIRLICLRTGKQTQRFLHRTEVVLGQRAGIGTRICQQLVLFIERLCNGKRCLG